MREYTIAEYEYDEKYHKFLEYHPEFVICHCYWNGVFGEKQLFSIKTFLSSQKTYDFKVILWIDNFKADTLTENELQKIKKSYNDKFIIQNFDYKAESIRTPYENYEFNYTALDNISDTIRFLLLYKYGGLWFDLDCCFLRDIHNFYANDFVYEWEFQPYANSALFYIKNPRGDTITKLVEMTKRFGCRPWEIFGYEREYMKDIKVYPCFYFDPHWKGCTKNDIEKDQSFDFFFKDQNKISNIDQFYPNSYVFHWHNHWNFNIQENSYFRLINNQITLDGQK